MQYRFFLPALALVLPATAGNAIEPSELKPGLVATYADPDKGRSVTRLEPTVAITLAKGESPHPALRSGRSITWRGDINLTRQGNYTFSATVASGRLTVKVGGKPVLDVTNLGKEAVTKSGPEVAFEGGVETFEAIFTGPPADAPRIELFWQGPGFIREPLAHQFLGHLAKDRPMELTRDGTLEHGRFKFEELACVKCHRPSPNDAMAKTLTERTGPNLTEVAKRSFAGWIYAWLGDPAKLRPHTTMPKAFADNETGAAERYAVTQFLVSLAGKPLQAERVPPRDQNNIRQSIERGRVLYHVTGCAACHNDPIPGKKRDDEEEKEPLTPIDYVYGQSTLPGPTAKYNLGVLGSKYRPDTLAAYLQDPLKTNPGGRMPHMNLKANEATDIARYLCRTTADTIDPEKLPAPEIRPAAIGESVLEKATEAEKRKFAELLPAAQWAALGERLVVSKGCVNCHAVEKGGKALTANKDTDAPSLDVIKKAGEKGCLDAKPDPAKVPAYRLGAEEREAVAAFVKDGLSGAGSPAPAYQARVALKRFNCLNCHQRDGEGGIPVGLAEQMRQMEKSENADDVRPPVLTGVGHKTRTSWLKSVLTQGGRARPWMQLRMPQYGETNVGFLPEAIASLEGTTPDDKIHTVPRTGPMVSAGRQIVGKGGLGCVSCHDIGGIANTGTRGPDLSTINQRVRYDWYERWLSQPLRMAPGTRMPQAFIDGKSTLKTVLDGDPHKQAEAMWAYLALGPGLPLPDGLEPPKGVVIAVKDRAEVLRTFMPDAGAKAIAVGYPGYVSLAFSADECRTAYAWGGNFLDASPVWNTRGGAPAKLLGQKFWTAPAGHPWGLTTNAKLPPDFTARANNPAFGKPLPLEPARIYDGPPAVQFEGYSLDGEGKPTFRYKLDETGKGAVLEASETPSALKGILATGLSRKFEASVPGGYHAWFLAGTTSKDPRVYDAKGRPVKMSLKVDEVTVNAVGTRLVLPDGERAIVLDASSAPAGTVWRFAPAKGGGWLAILKFPNGKEAQKLAFTLNLWALPKDDEGLLKELFAQ